MIANVMTAIIQRGLEMIRKCFTVNPNRTKEEIASYESLLAKGIYQGVEIFYPYKKSPADREIYKEAIASYLKYQPEMVIHLPHGVDGNIATKQDLEQRMNWIKDAIKFASFFGIKKATLHPGFCDGTLERSEAIHLAAKNIKALCRYATTFGITIMLENLIGDAELMRTANEYFELKELINEPNLKFIFDVAHFHTSKFFHQTSDILAFVDRVKDDLYHVHISDNDGKRDMHAAIGVGNIDFKTYFAKLVAIGYQGLYSSEVLFNSADDLLATAIAMDQQK